MALLCLLYPSLLPVYFRRLVSNVFMPRLLALASVLLVGTASLRAQQSVSAAEAKPIPPVKQLLDDVERNERTEEALQQDYTYHVHTEEDDFNGSGGTKKTTITDAESLTIDGVRVNRIVAKDGKPLSDEEKQKESDRIDKIVAKAKERRAKLADKGQASTENGAAVMPASRFLELGTFSNPRRQMYGGRPCIVVDYAGDPNAKTKT